MVDMNSCTRQLCYPWGKFFVITTAHQLACKRSLGQCFHPGSVALRDPVNQTYALDLNETFPAPLSLVLVRADLLSALCRPSPTAYLTVSLNSLGLG